jgi:hypothetical protein
MEYGSGTWSNDVQNDHATICVVVVRSLTCRTARSRIPFQRKFQAWAALLPLPALPFFSLPYLLDDEGR